MYNPGAMRYPRVIPPDLGYTHAQRKALYRDVSNRMLRQPGEAAKLFLVMLLMVPFAAALPLAASRLLLSGNPVLLAAAVVLMALGAVMPVLTITLATRNTYRRLLIEELRARGHDVCPACCHLRTGIDPDAPCPECGRTVRMAWVR